MQVSNEDNKLRRVHVISLGCARNRVDTEVMLGTLLKKDWVVSQNPKDSDAIIVNTCGFIQSAKEESIETILDCAQYKEAKPDLKLVVAGCLTQRYKSQLAKGLSEVDLFIGTDEFPRIGELLDQDLPQGEVVAKRANFLLNHHNPRVNTLTKGAAYVKVAEGCQHNCSFCIIPAIRGPLRSRSVSSIVHEVKTLVATGVVEINLIAQDLAAYGRDSSDKQDLLCLLKSLVAIEGLKWVRMLYVYPENISDAFLDFFAKEPKLVKYLDMPIQHSSDRMLKKMNRQVTRSFLRGIIKKVRSRIPGIALRTSVMVGFPGETQEDFDQLCEFVQESKFTHLGCFAYSQEEGTVAGRMPDQIEASVKEERLDHVMQLQRDISRVTMKQLKNKQVPVLITHKGDEGQYIGRIMSQAPEVDGLAYVESGSAKIGQVQKLRITDTGDYDVFGEIC